MGRRWKLFSTDQKELQLEEYHIFTFSSTIYDRLVHHSSISFLLQSTRSCMKQYRVQFRSPGSAYKPVFEKKGRSIWNLQLLKIRGRSLNPAMKEIIIDCSVDESPLSRLGVGKCHCSSNSPALHSIMFSLWRRWIQFVFALSTNSPNIPTLLDGQGFVVLEGEGNTILNVQQQFDLLHCNFRDQLFFSIV